MEEKLHNDGLEDFLRKSFEQYDDSPSDGLWDRIENDMDKQPKVRPVAAYWKWIAGIAAALLLIGIIGQHFYYNNKIDQLSQKFEGIDHEVRKLESENAQLKKSLQEIETQELSNQKVEAKLITPNKNELTQQSNKNQQYFTQKNNSFKSSQNVAINKENNSDKILSAQKNINPETLIAGDNLSTSQFNSPKSPINKIAFLNLSELNTELTEPHLSTNLKQIKPASRSSNFSIHMHRTEMGTNERISRTIQRPLPSNNHRIFTRQTSNRGHTSITGINFSMDLKNGWFVGTGAGMRNTTFTFDHSAALRFNERTPPNNPSASDHRFEYSLSTASGLMDIEVRAAQTDVGQTIGEDEIIRIHINSEHSIDYVSVPVFIGHRFGQGRLSFELRGGFLANFLTGNRFQVNSVVIDHPRLRNSDTAQPKTIAPDMKKSTVDFIASAGLNYALSKRWSANLSSTLLISSGSRHFDRYVQTKSNSTGIDFGLSYRF